VNVAAYVSLGSLVLRLVGRVVMWRLVLVFDSATLPETLTSDGKWSLPRQMLESPNDGDPGDFPTVPLRICAVERQIERQAQV
jgi:hypothetical protein